MLTLLLYVFIYWYVYLEPGSNPALFENNSSIDLTISADDVLSSGMCYSHYIYFISYTAHVITLINAASLITEANALVTTTTNTSVSITAAAVETTVTTMSSSQSPPQLPPRPTPPSHTPLLQPSPPSHTLLLQPSQSVLSLSLASAYPGAGYKRKKLSNVGDDSDQFINLDDSDDDDSEVITIS